MKKSAVLIVLALALGAFPGSARADHIEFNSVFLSGDQEFPLLPGHALTTASGLALLTLNPSHTALTLDLTYANLPNLSGAHFHLGTPGTAGPIVLGFDRLLPANQSDFSGTLTFPNPLTPLSGPLAGRPFSEFVDALAADNIYINLHTRNAALPANTPGNFPGGEIRGQVTVTPEPTTFALCLVGAAGLVMARRARRKSRPSP